MPSVQIVTFLDLNMSEGNFYIGDAFAGSAIHNLDVTSLSGFGWIVTEVEHLAWGIKCLTQDRISLSTPFFQKYKYTCRYVIVHFKSLWVSPCFFSAVTGTEYKTRREDLRRGIFWLHDSHTIRVLGRSVDSQIQSYSSNCCQSKGCDRAFWSA